MAAPCRSSAASSLTRPLLTGCSGWTTNPSSSTWQRALSAAISSESFAAGLGLTIGHFPQSIELATVGGWLACRGAGQYSTRYGKIEDIVAGLEVVLASGEVIRTGALAGAGPRSALGPDLTQLFVGSEGTLGIVTAARLRAHVVPPAERRLAFGFDSFSDGLGALRKTLRRGATPAVVRLYDEQESRRSFSLETNLLIALDEGDPPIVEASMAVLGEECAAGGATELSADLVGQWLANRNDVDALEAVTRAGIVVDTVEVAAAWAALPALYSEAITRLQRDRGLPCRPRRTSLTPISTAPASTSRSPAACPRRATGALEEAFYREAWSAVMAAARKPRRIHLPPSRDRARPWAVSRPGTRQADSRSSSR